MKQNITAGLVIQTKCKHYAKGGLLACFDCPHGKDANKCKIPEQSKLIKVS